MNPKISILVPVYNVDKYLEACLQSAVFQTLEDIEIICINDGSTDTSLEILRRYEVIDSRVKVINKENAGYGAAMNDGLRLAKGDYVGILESDDKVCPDAWQILYELASRNNLDLIRGIYYKSKDGRIDLFDSNANVDNYCPSFLDVIPNNTVFDPEDYPRCFWTYPCIWTCLFKRSFLKKNDIWFNETPGASYQDTSFAFKTWCCAKRAMVVSVPVIFYNQDNESSSSNSRAKVYAVCDEMHEIEHYLDKNNRPNIYYKILAAIRYKTYTWNLKRIQNSFKKEFEATMLDELKEDIHRHHIDLSFFDRRQIHEIFNQIKWNIPLSVILIAKPKASFSNKSFMQLQDSLSDSTEIFVVCSHNQSVNLEIAQQNRIANTLLFAYKEEADFNKTINEALRKCDGEYIALIDDLDDKQNLEIESFLQKAKREQLDFIKIAHSGFAVIENCKHLNDDMPFFISKASPPEIHNYAIEISGNYYGLYFNSFLRANEIYFEENCNSNINARKFLFDCFWFAEKYELKSDLLSEQAKLTGLSLNKNNMIADNINYIGNILLSKTERYFKKSHNFSSSNWKNILRCMFNPQELDPFFEGDKVRDSIKSVDLSYRTEDTNIDISIIVPVYNVNKYLGECLDSILKQSYTNFELICIDDGSTDSSPEILEKYASQDNRITVISKENGGLASTRNKGLSVARGRYVLFLDSDDTIKDQSLKHLITLANQYDSDIVVFGIDANHFPVPGGAPKWIENKNPKDAVWVWSFFASMIFDVNGTFPFAVRDLIRRDFLRKNDIWFAEDFRFGEDTIFQFELFSNADNVVFIPDKLYNYRINRPDSLMNTASTAQSRKTWMHLQMVIHIICGWMSDHIFQIARPKFANWATDFIYYQFIKCPEENLPVISLYFDLAMKRLFGNSYLSLLDSHRKTHCSAITKHSLKAIGGLNHLANFSKALGIDSKSNAEKADICVIILLIEKINKGSLRRTLDSLTSQSLKPKRVVAISNESNNLDDLQDIVSFGLSVCESFYVIDTNQEDKPLSSLLYDNHSDIFLFVKPGMIFYENAFSEYFNTLKREQCDIYQFGMIRSRRQQFQISSLKDVTSSFVYPGRLLGKDVLRGCFIDFIYEPTVFDKAFTRNVLEKAIQKINYELPRNMTSLEQVLLESANVYTGSTNPALCIEESFHVHSNKNEFAYEPQKLTTWNFFKELSSFDFAAKDFYKQYNKNVCSDLSSFDNNTNNIEFFEINPEISLKQTLNLVEPWKIIGVLAKNYWDHPASILVDISLIAPKIQYGKSKNRIGYLFAANESSESLYSSVSFLHEHRIQITTIGELEPDKRNLTDCDFYIPKFKSDSEGSIYLRMKALSNLIHDKDIECLVLPFSLESTLIWDMALLMLLGIPVLLLDKKGLDPKPGLTPEYLAMVPWVLEHAELIISSNEEFSNFATLYSENVAFADNSSIDFLVLKTIQGYPSNLVKNTSTSENIESLKALINLIQSIDNEKYLEKTSAQTERHRNMIKKYRRRIKELKTQLKKEGHVRNSKSYKLGHTLTSPIRLVKRSFKRKK